MNDKCVEDKCMNDKWLDFAIRIQSIAQAGLQYGKDPYDKERYEELRQISAEMISLKTDIPTEKFMICFVMKPVIRHPRLIHVRLYLLMTKFCWSMKITEPGLCPAAGAMWISPLHPIQKRKFWRKPVLP